MKRAVALMLGVSAMRLACAGDPVPLTPETTIDLGQVHGRIDHLTVDLQRQRLFVAELGNDSAGVVDFKSAALLRTLTGLSEPQGILFVAATDELYVASGGDGSVRVFRGADLSPAGTIAVGDDADNLRLDPLRHYVVAGYGNGGLALIDTASHRTVHDIPLQGHPESFQLSNDGHRAFVNIPDKHQIALVDLTTRQRIGSWATSGLRANFPMALESAGAGLWAAFRSPPRLVRFDTTTGTATLTLEICGDSDDVFIDPPRHRLYVICGSGSVEVWEQRGAGYERLSSIVTAPGARTGLFVPELDRLYIAVPTSQGRPAQIRVFRPGPG